MPLATPERVVPAGVPGGGLFDVSEIRTGVDFSFYDCETQVLVYIFLLFIFMAASAS